MKPMISALNAFVTENQRCPGSDEFEHLAESIHGNFMLKTNTNYVTSRGGTKSTDYILGYWVSDWHHCYRSWDQGYYDDWDNMIFSD